MQTALSVEDNLLDPVVIVAANKIMAGGRFEVAGLSQANMDKSKIFELDARLGGTMRDLIVVFFNQTLASAAKIGQPHKVIESRVTNNAGSAVARKQRWCRCMRRKPTVKAVLRSRAADCQS
ncbi:hypothetical protein [Rhizobium sp.]|uniref:hypothetical protein n=1 Tax=Rhizobium sp. TaxID=391 RepID=UPI0028AD66E5